MAVDLTGAQLPAARRALARAIAGGALGPGYTVTAAGDGVRFDGGARTDGPATGQIELVADGRARFEVDLKWAERLRAAQAVALAATVSVLAVLLWSWFFFEALPLGATVGVAWAAAGMVADRRRARRNLSALVRALPVFLVDERGEQPR
jgi:hypothetical protein